MMAKSRVVLQFGLAILVASPVHADQDLLASVKTLYASASYEAALLELNAKDASADIEQIDTYRALCLLALGRTGDAEQALEHIVAREPLYVLNETEYSPRLVGMFHDVRKRLLPATAQRLYADAKADFDAKRYLTAGEKFKQLLSLVSDVAGNEQAAKLFDLRELAEGFLALSEGKLAQQTAPPQTAPPAVESPPHSNTPAAVAPAIYTGLDSDVFPPVVVSQKLPPWQFRPDLRGRTFSGQLELVIDENGTVESVTIVEPIWPQYDAALLQAVRRWRYQPARKADRPVKFRKLLDIDVDPNVVRGQ
jgi:TonB family protein